MIVPCFSLARYSYWLKKHFPHLVHNEEINFVEQVLKINNKSSLNKYETFSPMEWKMTLGEFLYPSYVNFIVEVVIIWDATGNITKPILYSNYLAIREESHAPITEMFDQPKHIPLVRNEYSPKQDYTPPTPPAYQDPQGYYAKAPSEAQHEEYESKPGPTYAEIPGYTKYESAFDSKPASTYADLSDIPGYFSEPKFPKPPPYTKVSPVVEKLRKEQMEQENFLKPMGGSGKIECMKGRISPLKDYHHSILNLQDMCLCPLTQLMQMDFPMLKHMQNMSAVPLCTPNPHHLPPMDMILTLILLKKRTILWPCKMKGKEEEMKRELRPQVLHQGHPPCLDLLPPDQARLPLSQPS